MTEADLDNLLARFLDRSLPAAEWTHHAHLLVGMMLARCTPQPDLLRRLRDNIRAYNVATGGVNTDTAGYHETITAFYAAVLHHFADYTRHLPLTEAAALLLAGPLADRKIVFRAYDQQTLKTKEARLGYVRPDRAGFSAWRLALKALPEPMFAIRPATEGDIADLTALMHDAITVLLAPFLSDEEVEASREIMGLDTQLIADGTYFVVEADDELVGCGGWGRRATLFGGDHTAGRDAALLDPAIEPARVRAMYTRPGWARRGVGRMILAACEAAAASEGFTACELASTLGGEPLYNTSGYIELERFAAQTRAGPPVPLVRMRKPLDGP